MFPHRITKHPSAPICDEEFMVKLFNNSLSLTLDPLPLVFVFFFQVLFIFGCAGSSLLQAHKLSLVAHSRGYSLVVVCRLLIVMASLIVEHVLKALAQ